MKKLVSVLFALLLVGSFAFAADPGISFGGWGRMIFNATQGGDSFADNQTSMGPDWAAGGRVKFSVAGNSDNVGFLTEVGSNGDGNIFVTDNAKIWVKINDMVKIQAGRIKQDVLRGKIGDDAFYGNPDAVFQRFYPKAGLLLDLTPAEGVYLGAAIDATQTVTILGEDVTLYNRTTEDAFKSIQAGAGYVIPNIGHLRAQYVGGIEGAQQYFNAAFAYTAMEGIVVDAGAKIQIKGDESGKQSTVQIDSSYSKDALSAIVRVGASFGDDGASTDLGISGSWDVAYVVAAPVALGFEGSVSNRGSDSLTYSLLPYAKAGYGNGYLKGGFKYDSEKSGDVANWAIPIVLEYWF
jgi:hypothetical protein